MVPFHNLAQTNNNPHFEQIDGSFPFHTNTSLTAIEIATLQATYIWMPSKQQPAS